MGFRALVRGAWLVGAVASIEVPASAERRPTVTGEVLVWDRAVYFVPPGVDALDAEPAGRRRLGDYDNDYKKPEDQDSSKECFRVAQRIRRFYSVDADSGEATGCMACDPTIGKPTGGCPVSSGGEAYDCQDLIDDLYYYCSGKPGFLFVAAERPKRMPDGFFYDPLDTIAGKWTDEVQQAVKIAVEKCGCNAGAALRPAVAAPHHLGLGLVGLLGLLARLGGTRVGGEQAGAHAREEQRLRHK